MRESEAACAACLYRVFGQVMAESTQAAVDRGGMAYDAALGAACLSELDAMTCYHWRAEQFEYDFLTCAQPFRGLVEPGEPCEGSTDCRAGFCTGGTCPDPPSEGEACTFFCDTGLYCSGGTCAPPGSTGAACGDEAPCEVGLACRPVEPMGDQECAEPAAAGGVCSSDDDCVAGLACYAPPEGTGADLACGQPLAAADACNEIYSGCETGLRCEAGACALDDVACDGR